MTHISEAATATRITLILIDKDQDVPIQQLSHLGQRLTVNRNGITEFL
jgi:hypothetical protein